MPKFWEYLPKDVYNDWKANKFKNEAMARLRPELDAPEMPQLPDVSGGDVIPGAAFGWDTIKKRLKQVGSGIERVGNIEPLHELGKLPGLGVLQQSNQAFRDNGGMTPGGFFNSWERDVTYPASGIIQATGLPVITPGDFRGDVLQGGPRAWRSYREEVEKDPSISGWDLFASDVLGDTAATAGAAGLLRGLAKGVGAAGMPRLSAALTREAAGPGPVFSEIGHGLRGAGAQLPGPLSYPFRPSVGARADENAGRITELARRAADVFAPTDSVTGDAGDETAATIAKNLDKMIQQRRVQEAGSRTLMQAAAKAGTDPKIRDAGASLTDVVGASRQLNRIKPPFPLTPIGVAPEPLDTFRLFEDELHRAGTHLSEGQILGILRGAARKAAKEGGSSEDYAELVRTAAARAERKAMNTGIRQSRQETAFGRFLESVDAGVQKIVEPMDKFNRMMTKAILGTPAFPVTSIAEDTARAGLASHKYNPRDIWAMRRTAEEAQEQLAGATAGNIPAFVRQAADLSTEGNILGQARAKPSGALGRIKDFVGGDYWMRLAGQGTEPLRRGFWLEQYEKAMGEILQDPNAFDETVGEFMRRGFSREAAEYAGQQVLERQAAEQANRVLQHNFPGYAPKANIDVAMQKIMPFWGYQSHRWPYLLGTAAEHPTLAAAGENFFDATEGTGELRVPDNAFTRNIEIGGKSIAGFGIRPLQGSVFGSPAALMRPEFPPYYTGTSGKIESVLEPMHRAGFWEGTPFTLGQAVIRQGEGQNPGLGSLLPPTFSAPIDTASALGEVPGVNRIPGVEGLADAATNLRGGFGSDRFYDYAVRQELARRGILPAEATPEQIETAQQAIGGQRALQTYGQIFRFNPQEKTDYQKDIREQAIRAGIPEEVARKSMGDPLRAVNPETGEEYLNSAQRREIYQRPENQYWEAWRQVSEPLKRPEDKARVQQFREYNRRLEEINTERQALLKEIMVGARERGWSGEVVRARIAEVENNARIQRMEAQKNYPLVRETYENPQSRDAAFWEAKGLPGDPKREEDELARQYYSMQPSRNPMTGEMDWEGYRAQREGFLAQQSPQNRDYILNQYRENRNTDPEVNDFMTQWSGLQDKTKAYFEIPKYRPGALTAEDEALIGQAFQLRSMYRQLAPFAPPEAIYRQIAQRLGNRAVLLMRVENRLRNPERQRFLMQNPDVVWYLGSVPQSGIDVEF